MSKRWDLFPPINPAAQQELRSYHLVLQQLLFNRGLESFRAAEDFLEARIPHRSDPNQLIGMEAAVDRLVYAIQHGEGIAVYGDYDVDGVTATVLLVETIDGLGGRVQPYIPNRFDEGYGLNKEALSELQKMGLSVVVSVDCGVRSLAEAQHAEAIGLDLIITDHHPPGDELPNAYALIDPRQSGDPYPDKNLAGVGVAYKLACALTERIPDAGFEAARLIDLVALGTVADLAPLTGENRAMVRAGLIQFGRTTRQGLYSLMQVAGVKSGQANASTIGFQLGPRLNAAGRLESALAAYELLSTSDLLRAGQLAQHLDVQNRERQEITRSMQAQAEELAVPNGDIPYLLFASSATFNPGVVGLTAARLAEKYYRPSIVAERSAEQTRGSCRSIPEFHITEALDRCADLLIRHGGHAAAAGFTVANSNLDELIERLTRHAAQELAGKDLRPQLKADCLLDFHFLQFTLLEEIARLQPTGMGNPEPLFQSNRLNLVRYGAVGREKDHLKLVVGDGKRIIDAIAFRQGHWIEEWKTNRPAQLDLIYRLERNEWEGRVSLQLNVQDLRPSE